MPSIKEHLQNHTGQLRNCDDSCPLSPVEGKENTCICGAHSISSIFDVVNNYLVHEVIQTMVVRYTSKCDTSVRMCCE